MKSLFKDKGFQSRNARAKGIAVGLTVAVIVVAALLNVIMTIAADKSGLRFDMTKVGLTEVSDEARQIVESLKNDITITTTFPENSEDKTTVQLLKNLDRASDKVTVVFDDIYKNPSLQTKYSDAQLTAASVIVESKNRYKALDCSGFYSQNAYNSYDYAAEEQICSALLYCDAETVSTIYFTVGHGEMGSLYCADLLKLNGFEVANINLTTDSLPKDGVIVVFGPSRDFTKEEIEKLDSFADQGKGLMIFLDNKAQDMPVFDEFLKGWGVKVLDSIVLDGKSNYQKTPFYLIAQYQGNELTRDLEDAEVMTIVPVARPLEILTGADKVGEPTVLLSSGETSYLKPMADISDMAQTKGDRQGSFPLALAVKRTVPDTDNVGTLFLCGSTGILYPDLTGSSAFGNGDFLSTMVSTMTGQTNTVKLAPKSMDYAWLTLSSRSNLALQFVFTAVVPAAVLIYGAAVWFRRRNL